MFRFVVLIALFACTVADVLPLLDGRIVGGEDTTIENYPHQISLRYFGIHICGGALNKINVVVTAAHCVQGASVSLLSVVAGTSSRFSGGVSIEVSQVKIHPSFDSDTLSNDVAVLILESSFALSSSIQPIALANSTPTVGSLVTVTGWDTSSEGGSALQAVDANVINTDTCKSEYETDTITSTMLCAGGVDDGEDTCQGDSGGPLIQNGKLVAVASWGYGCVRAEYPSVYTNVVAAKFWIEASS